MENIIGYQEIWHKNVEWELNGLFSFRVNTTGDWDRALKEFPRSVVVNPAPYSDCLEEKRHEERKALWDFACNGMISYPYGDNHIKYYFLIKHKSLYLQLLNSF